MKRWAEKWKTSIMILDRNKIEMMCTYEFMSAMLMASLGYTFETKQHMTPACHACFLSFLWHIKILTVLSGGVSKTCIT